MICINVAEMMEWAADHDYTDLWTLIMFLVYEKKTLSLSDHSDKINFYTQEKFSKRMNEHLIAYKKQMNIPYKSIIYSIVSQNRTMYVIAHSENEAKFTLGKHGYQIDEIHPMPNDYEMAEVDKEGNETILTIKELKARTMEVPSILGGF